MWFGWHLKQYLYFRSAFWAWQTCCYYLFCLKKEIKLITVMQYLTNGDFQKKIMKITSQNVLILCFEVIWYGKCTNTHIWLFWCRRSLWSYICNIWYYPAKNNNIQTDFRFSYRLTLNLIWYFIRLSHRLQLKPIKCKH
jgi:hypothetical protein